MREDYIMYAQCLFGRVEDGSEGFLLELYNKCLRIVFCLRLDLACHVQFVLSCHLSIDPEHCRSCPNRDVAEQNPE